MTNEDACAGKLDYLEKTTKGLEQQVSQVLAILIHKKDKKDEVKIRMTGKARISFKATCR